MENLIPIVIFLVIVAVKVFRSIAEYQNNRPGKDDGDWDTNEGWTPTTPQKRPQPQAPGTPVRRQPAAVPRAAPQPQPTPSPRVQTILEQLKQQVEQAGRPMTAAPAARPVQPAPEAPAQPTPQPKPLRQYLAPEDIQAERQQELLAERQQPLQSPEAGLPQTQRELVDQTVATAFPRAMKMMRERRRGVRQPILLSARGRENLRRGVLMAEVLGPPRAYDV